jgi:hypothetical protein
MPPSKQAAVAERCVASEILPTSVYTMDQLRRAFGLKTSSLAREIREKRLRVSKRCGKYYFLGAWVIEWLLPGELKKKAADGSHPADR